MAEEERSYPVRDVHDFLFELNAEWDKFRIGSLIGVIASGALLVFYVPRFMQQALRQRRTVEFLFLLIIVAFLVYSIYALYTQFRFFRKWERRIGLLIHLEEQLISEKLGETPVTSQASAEAEKPPEEDDK